MAGRARASPCVRAARSRAGSAAARPPCPAAAQLAAPALPTVNVRKQTLAREGGGPTCGTGAVQREQAAAAGARVVARERGAGQIRRERVRAGADFGGDGRRHLSDSLSESRGRY